MIGEAISKSEFWFLDSARTSSFPVFFLLDEDAVETDLNQTSHGLSREQVMETLCGLFERGDLAVAEHNAPGFMPTREQIAAELDAGRAELKAMRRTKREVYSADCGFTGFHYELTALGGARWEKAARPDWSLFHIGRTYFEAPSGNPSRRWVEVEASTGEQVQRTVIGRYLWHLDLETQVWEVREPWHPTYWKTLPLGYYFGCESMKTPPVWVGPPPPQWEPGYGRAAERNSPPLNREWYHDPWLVCED